MPEIRAQPNGRIDADRSVFPFQMAAMARTGKGSTGLV